MFSTRELAVILSGNEDHYEPHSIFLFTLAVGDSKVSIMSNHRNYDRLVFCVVYTLFSQLAMLILNLIQSELPYQKKKKKKQAGMENTKT